MVCWSKLLRCYRWLLLRWLLRAGLDRLGVTVGCCGADYCVLVWITLVVSLTAVVLTTCWLGVECVIRGCGLTHGLYS